MSDSAEPLIACLNGEFIPFAEAKLPIFDLGIMQGATVTERLRTVRHRPYQVAEHLERLGRSLQATGIRLPEALPPLDQVIKEVARRNSETVTESDDLAVVIFVTAGQALGDSNGCVRESRPTVCVYTAPLPLAQWGDWHRQGVKLEVPAIRQVPGNSLSLEIKHRSRFHWTLADQQARRSSAGAMALLLDQQGFVTETSSGNLFAVRDGKLCTPRQASTLPGIAQAHVSKLAERRGLEVERCDMMWQEIAAAEEAFLTSSTYCLLPVGQICGIPIGQNVPGPIATALLSDWSAEIGISLVEQATAAADRAPK